MLTSGGYPKRKKKPGKERPSEKPDGEDDYELKQRDRHRRRTKWNPWDIPTISIEGGWDIEQIELTSTDSSPKPPVDGEDDPNESEPHKIRIRGIDKGHYSYPDFPGDANTGDLSAASSGEANDSSDDTPLGGHILSWYWSVPELGKTFNSRNSMELALWEAFKETGVRQWTVYEYPPDGSVNIYTYVVHTQGTHIVGVSRHTVDEIPAPEEPQDVDGDNDSYESGWEPESETTAVDEETEFEIEEEEVEEYVEEGNNFNYYVEVTEPDGTQHTEWFETTEERDNYIHELDELGYSRETDDEDNNGSDSVGDDWESDDSWWDDIPYADDDFWSESGLG